jgi:polar amino acid transport system substrate-binding protein
MPCAHTMCAGTGEPKLIERLSVWIAANLKNGKLDDIYKKFHGSSLPPEMLN